MKKRESKTLWGAARDPQEQLVVEEALSASKDGYLKCDGYEIGWFSVDCK